MYEPQIGDRVRRTFPNGTTMQGTIKEYSLNRGIGLDSWGKTLYSAHAPEETELINRPPKFKNFVGACYKHPTKGDLVLVKVDSERDDLLTWFGKSGDLCRANWFSSNEVRMIVENHGWIEHDIRNE